MLCWETKNIDEEIREVQRDFMTGKETRKDIYSMRIICERHIKTRNDVYACIVDYEDYWRSNSRKDDKDPGWNMSEWEWFNTNKASILELLFLFFIYHLRGVRQRCVLSPAKALFNLHPEKIFPDIHDVKELNVGGTNITNIVY